MRLEGAPACICADRHTGVKAPNATVSGSLGCGPGALLEWADEHCLDGLRILTQALSTSVCTAADELPDGLSEAM